MYDLQDFLLPINKDVLNNDAGYNDGQIAKHVAIFETHLPDIAESDIVLVGVMEQRGGGLFRNKQMPPTLSGKSCMNYIIGIQIFELQILGISEQGLVWPIVMPLSKQLWQPYCV
jgi:hypothetical protein